MASIKHLFHINAPRQKVFEAISTIKGLSNWWTLQTTGDSKPEGVIQFRFGEMGGPDMKVKELNADKNVSWECVASNHGWVGNTLAFNLDDNDGKTRVRFEHAGWNDTGDFYAACNFTWARYMESLRQFCQTGRGEAFGSGGYRK